MTNNFIPISLAAARVSLAVACDRLDDAVRNMNSPDGDDVMASPGLVDLLLSVVVARRQVRGLESVGSLKATKDA